MPTRTLSTLDYISIAEKRLKGLSQKQIADDLEVSVSLISKIEQTNEQYQRIYEDLLGAVVAERGRHVASAIQALERAEAVINSPVIEQAERIHESTQRLLAEVTDPVNSANFAVAKQTEQMLAESVNPAVVEQAERIHESTQRLLAEVTDPVIAALTWRAQEAAGNLSPDELRKALPFVSKDE
jgi:transcriptional regulator with XRE-family HTH domain